VSRTPRIARLAARAGVLLLPLSLVCGCGSDGPERYEVSGKVIYDGKPIPAGEVVFEPDPKRGNTGPQSRAPIEDGRYCTLPGQGSVPGPVIVEVRGYDGQPHPESPDGLELFRPYRTTAELPREDSQHDVHVPVTQE